MSFIENIIKKIVLEEGLIIEKAALSQSAIRVRIQSDRIRETDFIAGSFLRLGIGIGKEELSMKDKIRSYSVWGINKDEGYVDLAIATHSNGIGSVWAKECQVGDTVYFKWKKGKFLADASADSYLMIGDLSALSHLYMIHRNIGQGKQVESFIYSPDKSDLFPDLDGSSPLAFHELPANASKEIISKLKEIVPQLSVNSIVYIAGDSRICIDLTHYFRKELHWLPNQIKTKPFWNPEKKGLE
ncbi:hypothetical protein GCM10007049_06480 [Echinicola pacifica]|uniref:FAD-binding FR-type domain-containing protein n=1 Tax=Echinicola pacifica TaxID=346377 RepID=A0A918PPN7_9BACT|nr:siderophore-interacting protein [Echinicola pacifica]GGZ16801.1 hypothetical protein GCM10007049_06480 [Echinicola pacifica]